MKIESHSNARLEAFCDGVFAIALTLLIIDIKLPAEHTPESTADLWHALGQLTPSIAAFVLSFGIILITWVNHHGTLKMVHKATASFIYANGFLLLTVVFIPFPTSLLGEFVWTDQAAPAVVLYDGVIAVQAIGWILVTGSALNNHLAIDQKAAATLRANRRNGQFACAFYALLAAAAWWFPLASAVVTMVSWIFWLTLSLRIRHSST